MNKNTKNEGTVMVLACMCIAVALARPQNYLIVVPNAKASTKNGPVFAVVRRFLRPVAHNLPMK